jgi:hypothetical protein
VYRQAGAFAKKILAEYNFGRANKAILKNFHTSQLGKYNKSILHKFHAIIVVWSGKVFRQGKNRQNLIKAESITTQRQALAAPGKCSAGSS